MTTYSHATGLCAMLKLPMAAFCYYQSPTVGFEHANHLAYLHITIPKENSRWPAFIPALVANARSAIPWLIQLHIHHDKIIQRQRLLEDRL